MSNKVVHCPICNEAFVMSKYLAAHITRKHTQEEIDLKKSENEFSRF